MAANSALQASSAQCSMRAPRRSTRSKSPIARQRPVRASVSAPDSTLPAAASTRLTPSLRPRSSCSPICCATPRSATPTSSASARNGSPTSRKKKPSRAAWRCVLCHPCSTARITPTAFRSPAAAPRRRSSRSTLTISPHSMTTSSDPTTRRSSSPATPHSLRSCRNSTRCSATGTHRRRRCRRRILRMSPRRKSRACS